MASVYQDRKMMKWLPFEALPEQGSYLAQLYEERMVEDRPTLSQDHLDYLNARVNEAYMNGDCVDIEYFDQGHRYHLSGQIIGIDFFAKTLIFENAHILFEDVLNIT